MHVLTRTAAGPMLAHAHGYESVPDAAYAWVPGALLQSAPLPSSLMGTDWQMMGWRPIAFDRGFTCGTCTCMSRSYHVCCTAFASLHHTVQIRSHRRLYAVRWPTEMRRTETLKGADVPVPTAVPLPISVYACDGFALPLFCSPHTTFVLAGPPGHSDDVSVALPNVSTPLTNTVSAGCISGLGLMAMWLMTCL